MKPDAWVVLRKPPRNLSDISKDVALDNDNEEIMLAEMEAVDAERGSNFAYTQNVPLDGDVSLTRSDLQGTPVKHIEKKRKSGKRKRVSDS